jgi:hypothetical protein
MKPTHFPGISPLILLLFCGLWHSSAMAEDKPL